MPFDKLFLSMRGRIGRKSYWMSLGPLLVAQFVAPFIPSIGGLISVVLLYPAICLYAKRLHDLGFSGWWQAAIYGLTAISSLAIVAIATPVVIAAAGGPKDEIAILTALASAPGVVPLIVVIVLANIGFMIWLGAAPGQAGDNRFTIVPDEEEDSDEEPLEDAI